MIGECQSVRKLTVTAVTGGEFSGYSSHGGKPVSGRGRSRSSFHIPVWARGRVSMAIRKNEILRLLRRRAGVLGNDCGSGPCCRSRLPGSLSYPDQRRALRLQRRGVGLQPAVVKPCRQPSLQFAQLRSLRGPGPLPAVTASLALHPVAPAQNAGHHEVRKIRACRVAEAPGTAGWLKGVLRRG